MNHRLTKQRGNKRYENLDREFNKNELLRPFSYIPLMCTEPGQAGYIVCSLDGFKTKAPSIY